MKKLTTADFASATHYSLQKNMKVKSKRKTATSEISGFGTMISTKWNNLAHFAGEHVSYSHGWIEGAFESAFSSAYQVNCEQLK